MSDTSRPVHRRWRFYTTDQGNDVVRKELDGLPDSDGRQLIVALMSRWRRREELGRDQVKSLTKELRELRVSAGNNHFRLIFFQPVARVGVALTAFYKDTNKTPPATIKLADKRRKDWERRSRP